MKDARQRWPSLHDITSRRNLFKAGGLAVMTAVVASCTSTDNFQATVTAQLDQLRSTPTPPRPPAPFPTATSVNTKIFIDTAAAAAEAAKPTSLLHTVQVPANAEAFSAGLSVRSGDLLHFTAKGRWCMGKGECGGPDGIRLRASNEPALIFDREGARFGTLVGEIAGVDRRVNFAIGNNREVVVTDDGNLFLYFNEIPDGYKDNSGEVEIEIKLSNPAGLENRIAAIRPNQIAESPKPATVATAKPASQPEGVLGTAPVQLSTSIQETEQETWSKTQDTEDFYEFEYSPSWTNFENKGKLFQMKDGKPNETMRVVKNDPIPLESKIGEEIKNYQQKGDSVNHYNIYRYNNRDIAIIDATNRSDGLHITHVIFIERGKAYNFILSVDPSNKDRQEKRLLRTLQSFRFFA